ncbi:hypothetical protein IMCC14465_10760 [alpha proteobacterium IMCC14465]|uniref:Ribosomal RNA large subunit methyltransferase H n=1 Tax=alpha proteobacterium IMCC14465 TaxID=1220535 RepID=J9A4I3_9PROT|nr:hypothetical protein IMCC14465_10760 [alpha proteobacterium IMCC14465]
MRLIISAIGLLKKGPESDLVADYLKRLRGQARQIGISHIDIIEAKERSTDNRKALEADLLLAQMPSDRKLIALDEHGRHVSSRELATMMQKNLDQGVQNLCFVIGGADGLSETVLELADDKICLGKMTWPHQLVRVMLVEQLWRCVSILTNHPYHRD